MHKTKLFDEHILAEVRPFVSSMPEEQYVAQTNGSARMRVAKFEDGRYQVRGVPGHTHNSTAICSVEADFSKTRTSDLIVSPEFTTTVGPHEEEKYEEDTYDESEFFAWDREVAMYDRAIEKGIGNIRLVPENCHQEIDEPTRAIAEIRTLVSSKQQLDSLTYIDERGSHVDPVTGREVTGFVGSVDVYVLGARGNDPANMVHANWARKAAAPVRYEASRIVCLSADGVTSGIFVIEENTSTVVSTGAAWDGTRTFTYDSDKHLYRAVALSVRMRVFPVDFVDDSNGVAHNHPNNNGDLDTRGDVQVIRVDFDEFETEAVKDRNAMIRHLGFDQQAQYTTLYQPLQLSAPSFGHIRYAVNLANANQIIEPLFAATLYDSGTQITAITHTAGGLAVARSFLHGMSAARIPVGRPNAIFGGYRRMALPNGTIGTFGTTSRSVKKEDVPFRASRIHDTNKIIRYHDTFHGTGAASPYLYTFVAGPAALEVAVQLRAGPANREYDAGGPPGLHTLTASANARGFAYCVENDNLGTPVRGPLSVRMPDAGLCNDVGAAVGTTFGGSLVGRMQVCKNLVTNVDNQDHNILEPLVNEHDRYQTLDGAGYLGEINVHPSTGAALVDVFRYTQVDLQPHEVITYRGRTPDATANYRLFSQGFVAHAADLGQQQTFRFTNRIENTDRDAYNDDGGVPMPYYATFIASVKLFRTLFGRATRAAVRRRPTGASKPICQLVPCTLDFVHDRLNVDITVYTAYTATNAGGAGTSQGRPCFLNAPELQALITAHANAVIAVAGVAAALAAMYQGIMFHHLGLELSDRLQLQGGDPLPHLAAFCYRVRAADGTYPVELPITVPSYNLRFGAGAARLFAADDMTLAYSEPEYTSDFAVEQHIAYVDRAAGTTTNSVPFYALADVVSVSDTTAADVFCDIDNDINKAPYLQRLYSHSNARRVAAYGTSADSTRVNIINQFGAVPYEAEHLESHGYAVAGGAADVLACTAGIGDQVRVPLNQILSHGGAEIAIVNVALATNDPFPRYCHIFFSNVATMPARTYKRPTVMRFDMNLARLEMRQLTNAAVDTDFHMCTVAVAERYNTATGYFPSRRERLCQYRSRDARFHTRGQRRSKRVVAV